MRTKDYVLKDMEPLRAEIHKIEDAERRAESEKLLGTLHTLEIMMHKVQIGIVTLETVPGDPSLVNLSHQEYGGATFSVSTIERALTALLHKPRAPSANAATNSTPVACKFTLGGRCFRERCNKVLCCEAEDNVTAKGEGEA